MRAAPQSNSVLDTTAASRSALHSTALRGRVRMLLASCCCAAVLWRARRRNAALYGAVRCGEDDARRRDQSDDMGLVQLLWGGRSSSTLCKAHAHHGQAWLAVPSTRGESALTSLPSPPLPSPSLPSPPPSFPFLPSPPVDSARARPCTQATDSSHAMPSSCHRLQSPVHEYDPLRTIFGES